MRQYELILIVQPDLDEEATNSVIDRVKDMITNNDGRSSKQTSGDQSVSLTKSRISEKDIMCTWMLSSRLSLVLN